MARKTKEVEKIKEIASPEEIKEVQDEINEELLKEEKKKEKEKKNNPSYLFFTFFIKRLKEDKLYLFSFIITVAFLGFFSYKKLQATEGYYDKKNDNKASENIVVPTVNTDLNNQNKNDNKISDALDIADYVGIYSKEVTMNSPAVINKTCSVTSYKIVYQIKKDKSIAKYFINECVGTIKMWDGKLDYVSSGGARYISANGINYLFSSNNMKEVDGDTFKIDDDINSIKINQKINDIEVMFLDNNIVFLTNNDLISVKGNNINYQLSQNYEVNTNVIDKIVYKSSTKNQFKFIIFAEKEENKCYTSDEIADATFTDGKIYTIYSLKYDDESKIFGKEKEIVSRNKSDGCDIYKEDLESLEE